MIGFGNLQGIVLSHPHTHYLGNLIKNAKFWPHSRPTESESLKIVKGFLY